MSIIQLAEYIDCRISNFRIKIQNEIFVIRLLQINIRFIYQPYLNLVYFLIIKSCFKTAFL